MPRFPWVARSGLVVVTISVAMTLSVIGFEEINAEMDLPAEQVAQFSGMLSGIENEIILTSLVCLIHCGSYLLWIRRFLAVYQGVAAVGEMTH